MDDLRCEQFFREPAKPSTVSTRPCVPSFWTGVPCPLSPANSASPTAPSAILSCSSALNVLPVNGPPFRFTTTRATYRQQQPQRRRAPRDAGHRRLPRPHPDRKAFLRTRLAGAFLFLPVLAQLGFDRLVHDA